MKNRKFQNIEIEKVFNSYPKKVKSQLLFLRELIFQTAEEFDEIGKIEETLKWQIPSYITHKPQSGTTLRLSGISSNLDKYAIFVHCQTSLIAEFKEIHPELDYDGNRSVILDVNIKLPYDIMKHFIYLALTYHYRKKQGIGI